MPVDKQQEFTSNIVKLALGNTTVQAIAILSMPIVTRFYTPEMYGAAALFVSITTILGLVASMRYENAIVLAASDNEAVDVLAVCIVSIIASTLVCVGVIVFCDSGIISIFNLTSLEGHLWLVPFAAMVLGLNSALMLWNSRKKRFGLQAKAQILSAITMQCTKIIAGIAGFASSGVLIITSVLGGLLTFLLLTVVSVRREFFTLAHSVSFLGIQGAVFRYKRFPLVDLWGSSLNVVSRQLPILMLAFYFSPSIVGYWALAYAVVQLPVTTIGQSVGRVLLQRLSTERYSGMEAATALEVFNFLVAFSLPVMVLLGMIGADLFSLVFGEEWVAAGTYAQMLTPWLFFNLVASTTSTILYVYEKLGLSLFIHLLIFVARFLSLIIGGILHDIFVAIWLYSLSGALVYAYVTMVSMSVAGVRKRCLAHALLKNLALCTFLALLILALDFHLSQVPFVLLSCAAIMLYLTLFVARTDPIAASVWRP